MITTTIRRAVLDLVDIERSSGNLLPLPLIGIKSRTIGFSIRPSHHAHDNRVPASNRSVDVVLGKEEEEGGGSW